MRQVVCSIIASHAEDFLYQEFQVFNLMLGNRLFVEISDPVRIVSHIPVIDLRIYGGRKSLSITFFDPVIQITYYQRVGVVTPDIGLYDIVKPVHVRYITQTEIIVVHLVFCHVSEESRNA